MQNNTAKLKSTIYNWKYTAELIESFKSETRCAATTINNDVAANLVSDFTFPVPALSGLSVRGAQWGVYYSIIYFMVTLYHNTSESQIAY